MLKKQTSNTELIRSRIKFGMTKRGFTLAEVLITLGIIGVVAAMTIPTLMNQTNNKELITALKETYSQLSQAYMLAVQDNGTPDTWGLTNSGSGDITGAQNIMKIMTPYFKSIKSYTDSIVCFGSGYKALNGTVWTSPSSSSPAIILSNGAVLRAWSGDSNCGVDVGVHNICGSLEVDVNGAKPPNTDGIDYFVFWFTKDKGIIPNGSPMVTPTNSNSFDLGCKDKATASGHGCTAWVIYNGNMDYLKCNTLSWSGPTTCN